MSGSAEVFITESSRLESRWDPNYYRCIQNFREQVNDCVVPLEKLKRSLSAVQYGISERAVDEPIGVPMLRMINLQDDTWDLSSLKYIRMTDEEKKPYLLEAGDVLFNRTNSKELVGKCAVFDLEGEYVFASYLIRVRLKHDTLLPDYVVAFLSSNIGRIQIDAVSRQIAGMTNINAEEIRHLLIPMLDLTAQREIVRAWQAAILNRDKILEAARRVLSSIDDLLLDVLGIRKEAEVPRSLESRIFRRVSSDVAGRRLDPIANQDKRRRVEATIHASRYPVYPLRKLVTVSKHIVTEIRDDERYIGLENIVGKSGEYVSTSEKETVSTAVRFSPGQILFPKLRPYLNKTHLAEFEGLCSTEFHVFIPQGVADGYLTAFLRSRPIVDLTSLLMTGNTLPRLQMSDIERLPIPVPGHDIQKKLCREIADIYERVRALNDQARNNLQSAKRDIEALIFGKELSL
jgi:type I restriction enzyme, S subunit